MPLARTLLNVWRIQRAYRELPVRSFSLPARADIEPTTFCNFRCPHCPTVARPGAPDARVHLSLADFRRVLDQLPTVYRIKLVGLGEPLLNPDFFDMVREARRRRVRVLTTINGSMLDPDRRRELLSCGLQHLNISIDAADPETHARLRPGSDLERISDGIGALMRERGRKRYPKVRVWHVIQREATPEIPALMKRCVEWGVDGLLCTAKLTNFGSESAEQVVSQRRAVAEDLERVLPEACRLAEEAKLEFHCPSAPPPPSAPADGRACKWLWARTFITAAGRVAPCPYATGPEGIILGDLLNSDSRDAFADTWNGPEMQRLREAVRANHNPAFCRACYPGWAGPEAVIASRLDD